MMTMNNYKNAVSAGLSLILLAVPVSSISQSAGGENADFDRVRTVNIIDEPRHRTVLRDGNLRLLDVQINPGDTTLPHTHDSAILYTFISNGEGPLNGRVSSITSYVTEQYTHRVTNAGPGLFRIIALANYGDAIAVVETDLLKPAMPVQLDNEWFRSYRLELAPGESSPRTIHTYPVAIVQVSDGLVHVTRADGVTQELKAMGDWAWREAGAGYQIHNRSEQAVSLVINEGKR
jgi:quercetin dioxygenase-like cupin family protein